MKHNWDFKKLSSVCNRIGDGLHGTPNYSSGGEYYFVNGNNLRGGRITISEETKTVGQSEFEAHKVALSESTLLLSINGTIGEIALYKGEPVVLGKSVAYINCRDVDRRFCYYYFQLKGVQVSFYNIATGSTIKNLGLESLKNFKLPVPPRDVQNKIVGVLAALDAKIELNNKINTELEGIAKLLYDYWFVQFDFPMTAAQATALGNPQLAGKPYRTSGGKMIYNETLKSYIPVGWNCQKLVDLEPQIVTGKTPPTTDSNNFGGPIPFICIGDVRGNMNILKTELTLSEKGANLQKNKFIPKGSLCVTCIASPGLLGFATCDSQTNQQLNSVVFSDEVNRYFLFFYLVDYFKYSSGAKSGNTFANMNKGEFKAINILTPDRTIRDEFTRRVDPMFSRALNNAEQNQELIQLRDWLLPMLMNGQVTVN